MLSEEATNNNFIVFGLTPSGLEPTIYRIRGEHVEFCSWALSCHFRHIWLYAMIMLSQNILLNVLTLLSYFFLSPMLNVHMY
jgi:hypothetical protein